MAGAARSDIAGHGKAEARKQKAPQLRGFLFQRFPGPLPVEEGADPGVGLEKCYLRQLHHIDLAGLLRVHGMRSKFIWR
jgi:hypothetical protein